MQSIKEVKETIKKFWNMNEDQFDKEMMDYIDGVSKKAIDNEHFKEEAKELRQLLSDLKDIPLKKVETNIDEEFKRRIVKKTSKKQRSVRRIWPYFAAAASILIVFFIFIRDRSFESDYQKLKTNTDKLGFIYNLNQEQLSSNDINWLKNEIKNENNPNIKVTILDLLSNYESKLDKEFFNALEVETTPTVLMALLNIVENSNHVEYEEELLALSERKGLDITVRQKADEILSIQ
ncbi:hypothetical protein [uncultured Eudoraea sp.]|uniref:hypothetical protein n=1 Tax=uncultured Eudoraea sp. TaxID=1035614 RepID=UPI00260675CD|nr:hypothetical protein [uncultured Eudoraea sp.]